MGRSPLLAVPNVTAHPSTASVLTTVLMYNGRLVCGFFLPRDAMHKHNLCRYAVSVCVSVSLCVCHVRALCQKRIKISSNFFHNRASTPFQLFNTKRDGDIPTGTRLTEVSNAGGIGRNRDSERICLLLTLQQAKCCEHGRRWNTATISQVVVPISQQCLGPQPRPDLSSLFHM